MVHLAVDVCSTDTCLQIPLEKKGEESSDSPPFLRHQISDALDQHLNTFLFIHSSRIRRLKRQHTFPRPCCTARDSGLP